MNVSGPAPAGVGAGEDGAPAPRDRLRRPRAGPAHIAEQLGLESGDDVVIRQRRLDDRDTDKPEEVGASYLPIEIAAGAYLEEPAVVPRRGSCASKS